MKIWFPVIRGGSGTDVYTRRLAQALERQGIATELTWFPSYFQIAPFLLRRSQPPPGIHIIHTNSWNGFAFRYHPIPLVVTVHLNVLDPVYKPYKSVAQRLFHGIAIRRYEEASFRAASAVTTVSESTRRSLHHTTNGKPVQVIYNWVDTTSYSPAVDYRPPSSRPFQLLFVGNLSRRKGADLLGPIMRELGPGFELQLTSGIRGYKVKGLTENMNPLGRITDEGRLIEIYRRCDALLFPSRLEGFSLAPLEAMACGKPVIATHASSLPEVVVHGVTGFLCPRDNIAAFAAACRKLADNHQLLLSYGEAARRRATEFFSQEVIIPRYIALYEKLAEQAEARA